MRAMVLNQIHSFEKDSQPLMLTELPIPTPGKNEILVKISACGVCHTELDEIEGRIPPLYFPIVLGHQIVGRIAALGKNANAFHIGDRIGVAWIYSTCGTCKFCIAGNENLCDTFKATGRDINGGYAEFMIAHQDFSYHIPDNFSDVHAAPLLCAGAIGYRSLSLSGLKNGQNLGLTGFGASAHLVLKMVQHRYPNTQVFVFARNVEERTFAKQLGAVWTGDTSDQPPEKLNCIIDTTPVWSPITEALKNLEPGGRLVINAIRKENIDKNCLLQVEYPSHLWMEKEIKSVANVTRRDVREFLALAAEIDLKPEIEEFKLEDANQALVELKQKKIRGAKVLIIE